MAGLDCVDRYRGRSLWQVTSDRIGTASHQFAMTHLQKTKAFFIWSKNPSYLKASQEFMKTEIIQNIAAGNKTNITLGIVPLLSYPLELPSIPTQCAGHADFQKMPQCPVSIRLAHDRKDSCSTLP